MYFFSSSKLTFVNPDVSDLGAFSVVVTDTNGVSASHTVTEDGRFGYAPRLRFKNIHMFLVKVYTDILHS